MTSKPDSKTKIAGSVDSSAKKDGGALGEHHGNGNGVEAGLLATAEALHLEAVLSDTETHEQESDYEHGHLENGSLEASYTEEPQETTEEASLHDHEDVIHSPPDQEHVEEPEELVRSHSPGSTDHTEDDAVPELPHDAAGSEESEQEQGKDEIADIVGLLESTSFTSKHILQGSNEGVATDSRTPGSDTERRGIGEIPDEE